MKGTVRYDRRYTSEDGLKLQGYTDSDQARSAVDRKNTSGCCFNIGLAVISWMSRKQSFVALSTAEARYIATITASREVV